MESIRHEEYMKRMAANPADEIVATADRISDKLDKDWSLEATKKRLPTDPAERKAIPIHTGFIRYFPDAIAAVAKVSLKGGLQHGQTAQTLHWDRAKSGDELDAMMRHIIEEDWEQVAWRAMANLQKQIEKSQNAAPQ